MDEAYFPRAQCVLSNCVKTEDMLEFLEDKYSALHRGLCT